jgi:predicted nucleic acid-binding protein
MNCTVLDTSAIIRYFIPDGPIPEQLEETLRLAAKAEMIAISPELAQVEFAQVILKKIRAGFLSTKEGKTILAAALDLPIIYLSHKEFISQAFLLAHEFKLSVYDSLFLEIARTKNCNLISADQELMRVFVRLNKKRH